MRLVDADEVLRMLKNCKQDNPFFNGNTRPIWEMALDCAISCVEVKSIEVVRCGSCKYFIPKVDGTVGFCKCGEVCGYCTSMRVAEDYCSYGERRDVNEE